ncbi:isopentenyl-diphosphate Delta-isomerase [Mucilaginibacter phyllosphaerae]|nr:isopentenyl-diphosphate Delta-isomerase [Mucilaginibacter phyllosphaerae]
MLVNTGGQITGTMDKMAVHRTGALHLAFSIFIFNSKGQLLLQQRAFNKYHSGGLWTNTCCSHPKLGENTTAAAHRRLQEEMGMACQLKEVFNFTYRHEFENGLIEHEFDRVFMGYSDEQPVPNPQEVAACRYIDTATLANDIAAQPEIYTPWLRICIGRVLEQYQKERKTLQEL